MLNYPLADANLPKALQRARHAHLRRQVVRSEQVAPSQPVIIVVDVPAQAGAAGAAAAVEGEAEELDAAAEAGREEDRVQARRRVVEPLARVAGEGLVVSERRAAPRLQRPRA